jgi:hypothetical protein
MLSLAIRPSLPAAAPTIDRLFAEVDAFAAGAPQDDDMTAVIGLR